MVRLCLANGVHEGYSTTVAEATGVISQHIFRKHGFVDRNEIAYKDFAHDGGRPFANIEGHPSAIFMDKTLG